MKKIDADALADKIIHTMHSYSYQYESQRQMIRAVTQIAREISIRSTDSYETTMEKLIAARRTLLDAGPLEDREPLLETVASFAGIDRGVLR